MQLRVRRRLQGGNNDLVACIDDNDDGAYDDGIMLLGAESDDIFRDGKMAWTSGW